jgi:AsmA protein
VKADSFNISRAYQEIPLFQELASSASKAKGTVSMQYAIGGRLDASMLPDYPTLRGGGWVRLEDVSVKGMKLFNEVGRITGRDSVTNPRLKGVLIKSSVANNRIKIERTKMRIRGFRPRIEGYVYFNGPLDLRMRLGLPPFGIIGIPLTIKGTSEKPKIKMKKEQLDPQEEEKD